MIDWIDDHTTLTFWVLYTVLGISAITLSNNLTGAWSWIVRIGACWIIWGVLENVFCLTPYGDD